MKNISLTITVLVLLGTLLGCAPPQKVYISPETLSLTHEGETRQDRYYDLTYLTSLLNQGKVPRPTIFNVESFCRPRQLVAGPCQQAICVQHYLAITHDLEDRSPLIWLYLQLQSNAGSAVESPCHFAVVVDKSGSMAEQGKMAALRQALQQLADKLRPQDMLSMVVYDTNATLLLPPTPANQLNKNMLARRLAGVTPGGASHLEEGLQMGYAQLRQTPDKPHRIKRMLLFTDQRPCIKLTDPYAFLMLVQQYVQENDVGVSCFAINLDFGVEFANALEAIPGARYVYLQGPAQIESVFEQPCSYRLSPVATDLQLRLVPGTAFHITHIYGRTGQRMQASDQGGLVLQSQTFFPPAPHTGWMLACLKPSATNLQAVKTLARLQLRYRPLQGQAQQLHWVIENQGRLSSTNYYQNQYIHQMVLLAQTALEMRRACRRYHEGEAQGAAQDLTRLMAFLNHEMATLGSNSQVLVPHLALIKQLQNNIQSSGL